MKKMIVSRDLVPANELEWGTPSQTKIVGFSQEFSFLSIECPDRHLEIRPSLKQHGNTAIPTGIYEGELVNHHKFGLTFLLHGVPNFSGVLFPHIANSKEDLMGCLGMGDKLSKTISEKTKNKIYFLSNSKITKENFNIFIQILILRGELKIGDKIKVEVKRKELINNC